MLLSENGKYNLQSNADVYKQLSNHDNDKLKTAHYKTSW